MLPPIKHDPLTDSSANYLPPPPFPAPTVHASRVEYVKYSQVYIYQTVVHGNQSRFHWIYNAW